MRVSCVISPVEIPTHDGYEAIGVRATCSRCGHATESYGTGETNVRQCLIRLNAECPRRERNFYSTERKAVS